MYATYLGQVVSRAVGGSRGGVLTYFNSGSFGNMLFVFLVLSDTFARVVNALGRLSSSLLRLEDF